MLPNPPRLFLSPPHLGGDELAFVHDAFASNYIAPLGPMVDAFEQEFAANTGIPHCLALSSGTAAMHLALRELGVGPGDEVIASSLTFIGSVTPVAFLGADLVFLDSDRATWNLDPCLLAEELAASAQRGKLPKVVIPTDLYGQCADLNQIRAICEPYNIPVVADAAEAMGARYQENEHPTSNIQHPTSNGGSVIQQASAENGQVPLNRETISSQTPVWRHSGYGAKAAVFSFNGNKIITTSGGGMLASHDERLIAHARKLSQQAREPAAHYEHTEIGYNYRLSNILAAIGRGQLRVLDERVAAKRRIFEHYRELLAGLPGIEFMPEATHSRSNRWLTVILIDPAHFGATNEQIRLVLEADNIESRPIWKPMHLQPVFNGCRVRGGAVSERLFSTGLCLPSGTAMTDSDLERVAGIIRRCKSRK
jgi:dTDP-4-amino-4,6-dideoxygalactose transaminase